MYRMSVSRCTARRRAHWNAALITVAFLGSTALAAAPDCRAQPGHAPPPAERFACARRLAQTGEYAAALREYAELSARYPDNVDYLFGAAQVRFWSGDAQGALRLLPRARRLAPGYEAVWRLEYQVLASLGGPDSDARREAFRAAALQRFPDAAWLQRATTRPPARRSWEVGLNIDSLDNGAEDWQHAYAHVDRRSPAGDVVSFTLSEHRRFGLADRELAVGGSFKPSGDWIVDGGLRYSPNAEFLPETTAELGVARVLGRGWILGVDFRRRRYADDSVGTFGIEVQRYFGRFRASWQLQNTRLGSASSFVQIAAVNYFAESGSRYGITVAAGEEVEIIAPGRLLEMDISTVAVSGSHPLGEHLEILWRVGTHRQDAFYRRNTVGLSIAGQF
ncbi:MAG TPA: YaiO family outer membrane beta-barrel protein [Woeseiaceae bacterium]|nr:YaiO family outer membrane beta-barrel protein [Woeseiaceae bacterium]